MTEEMIVRCGFDSTPVAQGLRTLKGTVHDFGHSAQEGFNELRNRIIGPLGVVGAIMTLEKAMARAHSVSQQAESLGVSKSFSQDLQNLARLAEVSDQKMEAMFRTFVKGLPAGSDLEEEFYKMSDRLAEIKDPAERAQFAIETFGKSGLKMINIAGQGSEAVKELAKSMSKFSEADLMALERGEEAQKRWANTIEVWTAKLLTSLDVWTKFAGRYSEFGSFIGANASMVADAAIVSVKGKADEEALRRAEKIARLKEESLRVEAAMARLDEAMYDKRFKQSDLATQIRMLEAERNGFDSAAAFAESEEAAYDLMVQAVDVEEKILDLKKKQTEESKRQAAEQKRFNDEADRGAQHIADALTRVEDAKLSSRQFSIGELAGAANPAGAMARQILWLRQAGKLNAMNWNLKAAESQFDVADKMFSQLSATNKFLQNPMDRLINEVEKSRQAQVDLYRRSTGEGGGVVINPKMGE